MLLLPHMLPPAVVIAAEIYHFVLLGVDLIYLRTLVLNDSRVVASEGYAQNSSLLANIFGRPEAGSNAPVGAFEDLPVARTVIRRTRRCRMRAGRRP